ncbi:MAG: hypothetical protein NVSMB38_44720 [Ktedonobacteraceae bacterium]
MKTQDTEDTQTTTSFHNSRHATWLNSLGALVVVALLVGLSATAFAYWRVSHNKTAAPQVGTWVRVLDGYNIVSITAAPSNAAVLYACGIHSQPSTSVPYRPNMPTVSYTLLHSTDSGTHWQEVTNLNADCQLAINPANSNDIYAVAMAGHVTSNGQVTNVLKHSTDGGRSWTDIAPTLNVGNAQLSIAWHVQQLSMVGNHLFGIQWLAPATLPPIEKPSSVTLPARLYISRLIESSDAGHTWTIVDGNLGTTGQGTRDYTVSPSDPQTIYELVGAQWKLYTVPSTPTDIPTYSNNLTLYKTTDGGRTWTKLLYDLHYGSKMQLASSNPSLVYVGGTIGVMPLIGNDTGVDKSAPIPFLLHVSTDGGATWHNIAAPTGITLVQNWFVSADGQVYAATGSAPSGQPTATTGTIVPSGTSQIKPVGYSVVSSQVVVASGVTAIQRYDATSGTWSTITRTPSNGALIAVTTSTMQHKDALWFLSDANEQQVLYRETI